MCNIHVSLETMWLSEQIDNECGLFSVPNGPISVPQQHTHTDQTRARETFPGKAWLCTMAPRLLLLIHRVSYVCVCYWVQTDNVIARLLPPTLPCRIVHNNKVCVEWILCCSHSRLWWPSTRRTATNLMTTRSLIDFPPSRRVVTLLSTLK